MKRYILHRVMWFTIMVIYTVCLMCIVSVGSRNNDSVENIYENVKSIETSESVTELETTEPIPEETVMEVEIEEIETVETEPVEIVEVVEYYDVPLDEDLQDHIFKLCDERGIDPEIVIAIIERESMYDASVVGDGGSAKGLMQIWNIWHKDRIDRLGCTDLLDPYQNVTVGIDFLSELYDMGRGLEWTLTAYNGGFELANKHLANGTTSQYVECIYEICSELKKK